jgi:DNA-binding MarR family transcriptional regulator
LAQRAPASDRRSYALQLTPSGKRLLKKLRALSAAHEERVTAAIGREGRETLITLLRKLSTMLEAGQ